MFMGMGASSTGYIQGRYTTDPFTRSQGLHEGLDNSKNFAGSLVDVFKDHPFTFAHGTNENTFLPLKGTRFCNRRYIGTQ
jgi:hypothetical protein